MGSSYSNMTLKGPEQAAIADVLRQMGQRSFLTPTQNGVTMLCYTDLVVGEGYLTHRLSKLLACAVWQVMVHDDDIILYELYQNGAQTDAYNSNPGWGWNDGWLSPQGGNANALCAAFDAPGANAKVQHLLHEVGYVFASERHTDLAAALNLPEWNWNAAYSDLTYGEILPGTLAIEGVPPRPWRQWIVVNVPEGTEVEDIFEMLIVEQNPAFPHTLRARPLVYDTLARLLPNGDFTDSRFGFLDKGNYSIEFDLGAEPRVTHLSLEVRGDFEAALPLIRDVCQQTGWRAFDISGGWLT